MHRPMDRLEIAREFATNDWQRILFNEFQATLTSETRPFPCVFGVAGLKLNQLRFAFPETFDAPALAALLEAYLPNARTFGQNTSLVVIGRPGPVQSVESYRRRFWSLLRALAELDRHPWPVDVPEHLDSSGWEFSFAGESIFVVCNTPAHVFRQSRRSTSFMVTFQPRWVFDAIFKNQGARTSSFAIVRERLAKYDLIPASPTLGTYGDPDNREFAQYFLDEENCRTECPFHMLIDRKVAAA